MFWRAVLAFLACPGVVAFVLPTLIILAGKPAPQLHPVGLVVLTVGTLTLLWCVRDFYVAGKGTLAPWAPPQELVVVGLYRYSRNPMYVSVSLVLLGWAVSFWSLTMLVYALAVMVAFQLRVVWGEEPWLAERYGQAWRQYCARVPRWLI